MADSICVRCSVFTWNLSASFPLGTVAFSADGAEVTVGWWFRWEHPWTRLEEVRWWQPRRGARFLGGVLLLSTPKDGSLVVGLGNRRFKEALAYLQEHGPRLRQAPWRQLRPDFPRLR